jgi:hypothetical protein
MTTEQEKHEQLAHTVTTLNNLVKPGDTLYTEVTNVARSGMSKSIRVFAMSNNEPIDITYHAMVLLDLKIDQTNGGVKMSGWGMDMGFSIVYDISWMLFRDKFECIGDHEQYAKRCPSNDHVNSGPGRNDYTPHMHSDGGYALRQRWL